MNIRRIHPTDQMIWLLQFVLAMKKTEMLDKVHICNALEIVTAYIVGLRARRIAQYPISAAV
jgi:hypothetical protein